MHGADYTEPAGGMVAAGSACGLEEKNGHMKGYVLGTGTAGLYSRARLHWDGHQISDVNLFLHCANLPPSSTLHCSCKPG